MQLLVKNLHNQEFKVECDGDDSIKEFKQKIAKQNAIAEKYDPELIKLLYKGKVMEDEDSINNYSIDAEGYVVLIKQLPGKPKPPPKKKQYPGFNNHMGMGGFGGFGGLSANGMMQSSFGPSGFPPNAFSQPIYNPTTAASSSSTTTTQLFQPPIYVPPVSAGAVGGGLENVNPDDLSPLEDREGALRSLVGMGFSEDISQQALRASFYNIETAIEYITSGKIPKPKTPTGSQASASSRPPQVQTRTSNPTPTSPTSSGDEGVTSQLQQISQMLQNNPEQLQLIKQTIQAEHPEIAQMIDSDPQAFIDMLKKMSLDTPSLIQPSPVTPNSGFKTNSSASPPTTTPTVTLSAQEQKIIDRIQEMGFDRDRAIEAFLLADRNEEVAVNYLLS